MGDSENKDETQNREASKVTEPEKEEEKQAREAELQTAKDKQQEKEQRPQKSDKGTETKKRGARFRALRAEFKRVVWPDRNTIVKETAAVVIVTVILAAVIALLDFVIKLGVDKIIQIG